MKIFVTSITAVIAALTGFTIFKIINSRIEEVQETVLQRC